MEREKLQDNTRRVGTDYSAGHIGHWCPSLLAGRGWMPPSIKGWNAFKLHSQDSWEGKQIWWDNNHGNILQQNPPVPLRIAGNKYQVPAVFHPMAETEVSTVKLQPGSSSWGSHWYSNIQCDWGSLGINPSHFLLFLQLRNKDISLLLTAISAKHTSQPQSTARRQKLQLNKSFIKTTRECVTNSGYDYCRYSSLSWLLSYLYSLYC